MSKSDDAAGVSTLQSSVADLVSSAKVPCLTILGHPEPARLGERAALDALLMGETAELSRSAPGFAQPGETTRRELSSPHVSRTPIRLSRSEGAIVVDANGTRLRVAGEPVSDAHRVPPDALAEGVVLELGRRIVLLLHESSYAPPTRIRGILGNSDAIDEVRRELLRVADLDTPVLLRGETGTGKELAAHAIHAASQRSSHELVAVNMAVLQESMAASMLFGHARGAFTGAQNAHRGLFERASGGTLMLDEIGETPVSVQPMLLRAIETGRITRLGEEQERALDLRLVAATDADLQDSERSFSAALLHRLSGYEVSLPPLRARREDVPLLLREFLRAEFAELAESETETQDQLTKVLSAAVQGGFLARLVMHPLPGNARQLRNIARHLVISNRGAERPVITEAAERLLRSDPPPAPEPETPRTPQPAREQGGSAHGLDDGALLEALRDNDWSPTRAARQLGIPTGTLHGLIRRSQLLRRAADLSDAELRAAYHEHGGDLRRMADALCVSRRALQLALRGRDFVD